MTSAAIELVDLEKAYGRVLALRGVNLRVEQGEIFGFLGPNGAGKSTTIRVLFDLIRPTSGRAAVLGLDCQRQGVSARQRMGYLPGELSLYESLSGEETIRYFSSLRPDRLDARFTEALIERFGFDPSRRVKEYSRGNKQKLGLILALMARPEVLVLDEPTSGLDPLVHEEVAAVLEELAGAGSTVFFSSHVLSEVERMCHRVGVLREGEIVAVEDIAELKGRSLHILEVSFAETPPPGVFVIPGVTEVQRDGNVVHLEVRSNLDAVLKAIARYQVVDLRTEQPSLERVFLAYYAGEQPEAEEKTLAAL